jgi:hypothetical protein
LLPLVSGGEFAQGLQSSREAAKTLFGKLETDQRFVTAFPPELDIVVWAPRATRVSESSEIARDIFAEAEKRHLYLALANLPVEFFDLRAADMEQDRETIACLRSVLMKPEHREWVDEIWKMLVAATDAVLERRK